MYKPSLQPTLHMLLISQLEKTPYVANQNNQDLLFVATLNFERTVDESDFMLRWDNISIVMN